jgi:sortase A
MHDETSQSNTHQPHTLLVAGRISLALLLMAILVVAGVACSPMVQIQVTRGVAQAAMVDAGNSSAPAIDDAAPLALVEGDAPDPVSPQPAAPVANGSDSQMRLAAPIGADLTPLPTATVTPTAAPTAIPPATAPPDRLVIPSIRLDTPVRVAGWLIDPDSGIAYWETLADVAGFHQDSALPGWKGNTVLSGHHNIDGLVFEHLHEVQPGDAITLYVETVAYHYRVVDQFIVPERDATEAQRRQNAAWIAPTDDERLTLVTCWPANDNSHRVIVIARPVTHGEFAP